MSAEARDSVPFFQRRERLRRRLSKDGLAGMLITKTENVRYLTGFGGDDSYLLLWKDHEILISDSRFTEQIRQECPGLEAHIRRTGVSMHQAAANLINRAKLTSVAVEASLPMATYKKLKAALKQTELVEAEDWIEQLRAVKDKTEIARIRKAVQYAERGFAAVRATLRPEHSEKEIADLLEYQMRTLGARCSSFPTIVAVGERAALPHAIPSDRKVSENVFILIDWGADEGWYKSDLTRVLITGRISPKFAKVYQTVLRAQQAAIAAVRPGVSAQEVDAAARQVIADAGFGRLFGHGLGHGVGLEIHELPRLGPNSSITLKPGMVITIEPGIYIPDWGGVRLEDDVLVTRDGCEVLTRVPKDLEEVVVF
ncbi:MAG: Xaa-Pro peptidase family protein [Thermogutta sp.]|nr:Xaa-Pro peptidase family protein [Thermogutta sp.]HPU06128.1 Xaa-Pro peptidase family protein [Thermogutta sp.]HQF12315.1 Xaa-Pro peptidase family protein [Thermogutta sp.]